MNKRILLPAAIILGGFAGMQAQRATDVLDRGLVAVKSDAGVFCSWRINAEEWYDVKYNIYRDGTKLNESPLDVSNFTDADGSEASTYTVTAVVNGVEQPKSKAASVWASNFLEITPKHDTSLTSTYVPNDACCVDVDGDGELEILMKYDNRSDADASYPHDGYNGEYTLFECLKLDGTVLWWVNCGPNMSDFQNNEQNIVGFDWDGDGKGEVVMRAADGTTIHMADGSVYTVGDPSLNYRGATGGGTNWFMHSGKEYLLYMDGLTGKPYQCIDYPLPRLEDSENPNGLLDGSAYDALVNSVWGDGYGHRSSKHFFGAPFLDGRHPSIFLARGIYTQHKMIAYDVNPDTHELVERWRWRCSEAGSPWYGQGYHNYTVADVDWDGRDEIVFGSMVIDDNGHGLSTTGLGHGDSHHVGDFDPYTHGQEIFACNEDLPNNNYRDGTTSKIYYRTTGGSDDGRANCGNFIDEYPGAQGLSSRDDNLIGGASHTAIAGDSKSTVSISQNFRIYWDGDLCDESFDYNNGRNTPGAIFKARQGRIALLEGSQTNNDTKGTPCYQGDILGDWREEVMMRTPDNKIRIFTTQIPTEWRNYTLWHDHQYRNAMVWQMCGYNQTPHPSYFLGEMEGITEAPAPLTMTGRTEVANGGTIGSDAAGKHLITCEYSDMTVNIASGAAPAILTVNAPSWVQGHDDNNNITSETYTHTLTGGALTGSMRLVKQGDGALVMPAEKHTYTGKTEIWAGDLYLDGELENSPLWLNRHTSLYTGGGVFAKGIDMYYGSTLNIGSETAASKVTTDVLSLGFGSVLAIDLFNEGSAADMVEANVLKIERKDWKNGPAYLQPILRLTAHSESATLDNGKYLIGKIGKIEGDLADLLIEGINNQKVTPIYEDGMLYIEVKNFDNTTKTWSGASGNLWDLDESANFSVPESETLAPFYPGDEVIFDDSAENTDVVIAGNLMPKSLTFNNEEKDYTISGDGSIVGETSLVKNGAGKVTISNVNQFSGNVYIYGGTLAADSYANSIGTSYGSLSSTDTRIRLKDKATFMANTTGTMGNRIVLEAGGGTVEVPNGVTLTLEQGVNVDVPGQFLYKTGQGTLSLATGNRMGRLIIERGSVNAAEKDNKIDLPTNVEFINGSLYDESNIYTYSTNSTNFIVAENNTGSLYLDSRCNYTGKLTGAGTLRVYAAGPRNYLQGDWSEFTGTVYAGYMQRGSSYDPDFVWDNNYGLPHATFNIPSSVTVNMGSRSFAVGSLAGSGTLSITGSVTIGSNDKNVSFTGKFSGLPDIVKVGTGDWSLKSAITGIKTFTAKDGSLSLDAKAVTTVLLNAPLTISDNAVLRGKGTVTSLTVNAGGTLQPGSYSGSMHTGGIYTAKDLTVEQGGTLALFVRRADGKETTRSFINCGGKLTLNGTVKVELASDYTPRIGDEVTLWTCSEYEGNPTLDLPELPEGMAWEESVFEATGVLRIIEKQAGISSIPADSNVTARVYTTDGLLIGSVDTLRAYAVEAIRKELKLSEGIYIIEMITNDQKETIKAAF